MNGHDQPLIHGWPEAGPSTIPGPSVAPFTANQAYYQSDPTAGPSAVSLNSPHTITTPLPPPLSSSFTSYMPPPSTRARGRGRVRGRGTGVGRGRGRGRGMGRGGGGGGTGSRQSTRTSSRVVPSSGGGGISRLKLSLKMNASGAGEGSGGRMSSFLGEYDRELDENPEEPLEFEEQFILRVPKEVADGRGGEVGLREMIKGKGKGLEGIEFKFLDSRRAAVKINGHTYSSKLVDLPCIIESQKTHDSRHLFKVADISQMLVVDRQVASEANIPSGAINQDDYIWPHGLTPPLRHVRKRRFRKRLSRRTIEIVEEQVEDLLKRDLEAETSSYDLIDALPDPDAPDSYYQDYDPNAPWQNYEQGSEFGGSEMYEDPGSVLQSEAQWAEGEEGEEGEEEDGEGEEDDFDQELAQALMEHMDENASGESDDEDGFDEGDADDADEGGEDDEEDEDDEETAEKKAKIRQFASEIKQLEVAIDKKRAGFQGGNPIMIKRFEETIAGMQNDINTKAVARQALIDELERAKPREEIFEDVIAPPGQPTIGSMQQEDVIMRGNGIEGTTGGADTSTPADGGASQQYDDVDDLFDEGDDADASGTEAPETPVTGPYTMQNTPERREYTGGEVDAEGEEAEDEDAEGEEEAEDDDEMAAMLAAELNEDARVHEETEALAAIDAIQLEEDLQQLEGVDLAVPSSPMYSPDFSTREGGVGMRRLVEGAESDSGSESSDDSDD